MINLNWQFVYSVAIFLDILGFITGAVGVGLILNRIISFLAIPSFCFYFLVTGAKGWWRILIGGLAEEIPVLGDFLPFWTATAWRIHKKNMRAVEKFLPETKESIVSTQIQDDQLQQI